MDTFIMENPLMGIIISLIAFTIGTKINKRITHPICNPFLIALILIIYVLKTFQIDYEIYKEQNQLLSFLLGPATVALAVPLYRNIETLKKNLKAIVVGVFTGSTVSICTVVGVGVLMGANDEIIVSMAPKAVTTPIAMEVSKMIGGIPALTAGFVSMAGIFGACFAPEVLRLFKIHNKVALGIAIGTTSHALGTTRAFQEGEVEGAMSSLSIGIAGFITAIIAPYIVNYFL